MYISLVLFAIIWLLCFVFANVKSMILYKNTNLNFEMNFKIYISLVLFAIVWLLHFLRANVQRMLLYTNKDFKLKRNQSPPPPQCLNIFSNSTAQTDLYQGGHLRIFSMSISVCVKATPPPPTNYATICKNQPYIIRQHVRKQWFFRGYDPKFISL